MRPLFFIVFFLLDLAHSEGLKTRQPQVDARCDQDFLETYLAKKDCLLKNDKDQCRNLAILNKVGVAAANGGLGAFAGKVWDSYLNKQTPSIREKVLKVIEQAFKSHRYSRDAYKMLTDFKDEATREITNGKIRSFENLNPRMFPERSDDFKKAFNIAKERFRSLIEYEEDLDRKSAMRDASAANDIYSKGRLLSKIQEVFPKEYEILKPFYDERTRLYDELFRENTKVTSDSKEYKSYKQKSEALEARFAETLAKGSEQLRLVNSVAEHGLSLPHLKYYRKPIYKAVKELINKENIAKTAAKVGRIVKGVGSGVAVGLGLETAWSYGKNGFLNQALSSCKDDLGISKEEIEFLGEYHILGGQNVVYAGTEKINLDCNKFSFNPTSDAFEDSFEQFGGIPKGVCQMMINESKSIDALVDDAPPKISCDENSYLKILSTGKALGDVEYFYGGGVVVPYDKDSKWPYTSYMSRIKGWEDFHSSSRCMVSPMLSAEDNQSCPQLQIVSCYQHRDKGCTVVGEAMKARVGTTLTSSLCPTSLKINPEGSHSNKSK